jgi:HEAT repeat protein
MSGGDEEGTTASGPDEIEAVRAVEAARRRGEVALAGRCGDEASVRAALTDPEPKVRVAALAALVRMARASRDDVATLLADGDPGARRSACELATGVPGSPVAPLLDDEDPGVVEAAAFALGELEAHEAVPRLAAIAREHSEALCREAAVAALGAIGDEEGRAAVLGALEDAPAIRRRAVVALAAFEGEDVDAALRARLEDRDWQVRQSAQDVLGLSGEEPR